MNDQEAVELMSQVWVDECGGDADGFWTLMENIYVEIGKRTMMKENVEELKNEHLTING